MPITIEVLQKTPILISFDNITEIPKSDDNQLNDLPENDENEKKKKMNERLKELVENDWSDYKIRLIAWFEEEKRWYMWTKAQESKDP